MEKNNNTIVDLTSEEKDRQIKHILFSLERDYMVFENTDEDCEREEMLTFLSGSEGQLIDVNGFYITLLGSDIVDVSIEDGYYTKVVYIKIHDRIFCLEYNWGDIDGCVYVETVEMEYYKPSDYKIKN